MDNINQTAIIVASIAAITTLVVPVITYYLGRRKSPNHTGETQADRLKKTTALLSDIVALEKEVETIADPEAKRRLRAHVDEAYTNIKNVKQSLEQSHIVPLNEYTVWKRSLLLFWPLSFGGWITHILFFLFVFLTITTVLISPMIVKDEEIGFAFLIAPMIYSIIAFGANRLSCAIYKRHQFAQ